MDVENAVEVTIEPEVEGLDATDQRLAPYVSELVRDLRDEGVQLSRDRPAMPGEKGALQDVIVNLTDPVTITAVCTVLAAWLRRPGKRSARVTLRNRATTSEFVATGSNVTDETLREALNRAGDLLNEDG